MAAEDEARAAAYRQQLLARKRFRDALERSMKGNEAAKRALAAKYEPLRQGQDVPLLWERV